MTIQIDSTTDTQANIKAAIGAASTGDKPAPAAGQKAAPSESGTEAPETQDDELKTDSAADEAEDDSANGDAEQDKPKKKGGFQRRIDKLNAAKAEAQRERDYWRDEALKHAPKNAVQPEAKADPIRELDAEPQPEAFDSYKNYVKAMTAWTVKDEAKKADREQVKSRVLTEQREIIKSHSERVESFSAKHEDFLEKLENLDHIQASPAMQEIITTSDHGPAILYELAKDPKEAARIAALSPLAAAREIGKIESKFVAAAVSADAQESTETKKTTKAPAPPAPVTAKTGSVGKSIYDAEKMSQAEYEAARRKQRAAHG